MTGKKNVFEGLISGNIYDLVAGLTGYSAEFYRRAAMAIPVRPGQTLLDLGCGTASLTLALAERLKGEGRIIGIDLSERQLRQARKKVRASPVSIELRSGTASALPFDDESIDGICMCEVLHGLPKDARDETLNAAHRVLCADGFFALVEWSRPRFGYTAAVWTPSLLGSRDSCNWKGTYPVLFERFGYELVTDVYLDSLNRCQVFKKCG